MTHNTNQNREKQAGILYKRYGKPLEEQHWGKFIAISPGGKTVIASTVLDVMRKALKNLGRGSFIFKIGERVVWNWR